MIFFNPPALVVYGALVVFFTAGGVVRLQMQAQIAPDLLRPPRCPPANGLPGLLEEYVVATCDCVNGFASIKAIHVAWNMAEVAA
ncbi:hypothetical protein PtB15_9B483 [Puccinia triticina]|nr:hypothetical protein PtB15_9B483 [Puccinia triticina]